MAKRILQLLLHLQLLLLLFRSPAANAAGRRRSEALRAAAALAEISGPPLGLVMAYPTEADALRESGEFKPATSTAPFVDLYGRRFHVGSIRGVNVVWVLSGQRRLNAGTTVQVLLDIFDVWGVIHYGTAGCANDSMTFGDVSAPKMVAFTGSWTWTKFHGLETDLSPKLQFSEYNVPNQGENLLSEIVFKSEEFYSADKPMQQVFWMHTDPCWLQIAQKLQVELDRCVNKTYCLPKAPKLVSGLKGSTADIFIDNAAYRDFLFREFEVSTVDEESAAVVMTAMSASVPVIVFRGVSDLAGGEPKWSSTSLMGLASTNALKVAVEFIAEVGRRG